MRLRYEINRHGEWEVRSEGDAEATTDQAIDQLRRFTIQHPHRLYIDGKLVAEARWARNGRAVITRHN